MHPFQPAAAAPAKKISSLSYCSPLVVAGAETAPALCVTLNFGAIMTATLTFAAPAAGTPSHIAKRLRELAAFSAPFMVGGIALHFLLAC